MKSFIIEMKYSQDGTHWTGTTRTVKSDNDIGAIMQAKSLYRYVKEIRIINVTGGSAMRSYIIQFQYSSDGTHWAGSTRTIKADSDEGAMTQIQNMFSYVREARIIRVT